MFLNAAPFAAQIQYFCEKITAMSTVATIQEGNLGEPRQADKKQKRISWETFQREYLTREDGYKYEWLDGVVEKTKRTMDYSQLNILENLLDFFHKLKLEGKVSGQLVPEGDMFFLKKHRRPDFAYLTQNQMVEAKQGGKPTPLFVVEVVSKNNNIDKVDEKMEDYFDADVAVVWHIFPKSKKVYVYLGTKMNIYKGEESISAAPVLPQFKIKVVDIFK